LPRISVVICGYTHLRWALLERAVQSVLTQSAPPDEVLVVADHDEQLLELVRAAFPQLGIIASEERPGLSGARNSGLRHSSGDVVAFLDDDAQADPNWLARLEDAFADPLVIGVGGRVEPEWADGPPDWLPGEFYWVVGCSYRGLPSASAPVRNPIGANMAFRRDAVEGVGGFADGIGRVGATPLGCEETELAIRLRQHNPGAVVLYLPDACVRHRVPRERTTWGYYRARCWSEGLSKAVVTRAVGVSDGLASERSYVARTLRQGVLRGLRDATHGDRAGLLRAGAIAAGLTLTTAGYVRGRFSASGRSGESEQEAGRAVVGRA
jgi:glycosyltransferase involved in cell wall biosynthesis